MSTQQIAERRLAIGSRVTDWNRKRQSYLVYFTQQDIPAEQVVASDPDGVANKVPVSQAVKSLLNEQSNGEET